MNMVKFLDILIAEFLEPRDKMMYVWAKRLCYIHHPYL